MRGVVLLICVATAIAVANAAPTALFGTETNGAVFDDLNVWLGQGGAGPIQAVRIVNIGWADPAKTPVAGQVAKATEAWEVSGAVPIVTWYPYAYANWTSPTPNADISSGAYDAYLDAFFTEFSRSFIHGAIPPRRAYIRFAPAPNGNWFPWAPSCPACDGNGQAIHQTAASYVQMWRYVRAFANQSKYGLSDATTVQWIFEAATYNANGPPAIYFPGDDVVDWLSAIGANYGTTMPGNQWTAAAALYQPAIAELQQLGSTTKPIALLDCGSVSVPNGVPAKAQWLTELLTGVVGGANGTVRMVALANTDNGPSDLAVFGGIRGETLWFSPTPDGAAYWTYGSVQAAVANTSAPVLFAGPTRTNTRLITDAEFAGRGHA